MPSKTQFRRRQSHHSGLSMHSSMMAPHAAGQHSGHMRKLHGMQGALAVTAPLLAPSPTERRCPSGARGGSCTLALLSALLVHMAARASKAGTMLSTVMPTLQGQAFKNSRITK